MRKIIIQGKSKTFPRSAMWNRIITIKEYPQWVKYCKSIAVAEVKEGATFYDLTTVLFIPLRIKHIITKITPFEEIQFFLPLPGGGKMWHTFTFRQKKEYAELQAEILFDLGTDIVNATVGYILEKRWEDLLKNSLLEIEEIKRIR